jgi:eukaryotic-like serine/threonine-protein kinase
MKATDSATSLTGDLEHDLPRAARGGFVAGKYRIFATLGRGGMADVYLAAAHGPAGFNKLVVVKKLRETCVDDPSFVTMFLDEARLSARLNHPNVVHTYEIGEHNDSYFIAMEYLEGQPLHRIAQAMRRQGTPLSPTMAAHIVAEALHGLHYAHEMKDYDGSSLGIVHRDVSPQNLHIAYDGQVRVLDFGIAKASLNTSQTEVGVLKGKFAYMAPEQAIGNDVDRRSDVFAAGIVLWEILTGERLFKGDNAVALSKLLHARVAPPSTLNAAVPAALDAIVMRALQRRCNERFATAYDMASALEDYIHSAGNRTRREDVARALDTLFGELRTEANHQIRRHMAEISPSSHSASDLSAFAQTGAYPSLVPYSGVSERQSRIAFSDAQSSVHPPPTSTAPLALSTAPSGFRSRVPLYALAVALAAGVGALAFGLAEKISLPRSFAASFQGESGNAGSVANTRIHPEGESFHLTLSSEPLEGHVEWGGKSVGQTPMLIDLLAGPQTFVLSREGYFSATVVVNVTDTMAGQTQSRTVVLVPRPKLAIGGRVKHAEPETPAIHAPVSAKNAPSIGNERVSGARHEVAAEPQGDAPESPSAGAKVGASQVPTSEASDVLTPSSPTNLANRENEAIPTVLPFGPNMSRPILLSGSDPLYSREAIIANVEGVMIAKCTITTVGMLQNCRIVKGLPHMDKSMLDSLATRRYSPVVFQGKAIAVEYVFNIRLVRPR